MHETVKTEIHPLTEQKGGCVKTEVCAVGSLRKCVCFRFKCLSVHEEKLEAWQSFDVIGFEMTFTDEKLD